jgi:hypothetical protein
MAEDIREVATLINECRKTPLYSDLQDYFSLKGSSVSIAPKKVIVVPEITTDADYISLLPISDVHKGSKYCDEKAFLNYVNYIESNDNTYSILLGDMHEAATKLSVGKGNIDEKYQIDEQRYRLQDALSPIANKGKIICGIQGNHEYRFEQFGGHDPMAELCRDLDVPYGGYQAYVKLTVNGIIYHIMAFHGSGGSSTKGGKINAAMKPNRIANIDLYLTGHSHDELFTYDVIYEIDDEIDAIVARKRYYVVCGSFLGYFGGYGEMKGLPPSSVGAPLIHLGTKERAIHCSI